MRTTTDVKVEDIAVGSHRRANIVMGLPSLGLVPIEFVVTFARLQLPMNGSCGAIYAKGLEVGAARNYLAQQFLEMSSKPDYLFFLGDDMLPPWNALVMLHEEMVKGEWNVLTALYYMKGEPPTPLMWRNDITSALVSGIHYEVGEVVWVDLTGLDFTLIKRSLLEKLEQPFFKTGPTHTVTGSVVAHTEDVWFMEKVKLVGGTIAVHTGVRVSHLDKYTGMVY